MMSQTPIPSRVARAPAERAQPAVSLRPDRVTFLGVALLGLALGASCRSGKDAASGDAALADTLKGLIEAAYDFSRPGVLTRMGSLYPDTGRVISASGGRMLDSPDSLRAGLAEFWRTAGQYMREARWEWGTVYVQRLAPDAAVLSATWSIPHLAPTGRPHVIGGAWTAVFRRLNGEWKIVTEHLSSKD
jgi:hypothetical protein